MWALKRSCYGHIWRLGLWEMEDRIGRYPYEIKSNERSEEYLMCACVEEVAG